MDSDSLLKKNQEIKIQEFKHEFRVDTLKLLNEIEAVTTIDILINKLELPIPSKQADHLQGYIGFTVPTVLRGNYE